MYISNAKLTNLEEISVSSFLFFTLLVGFSSLGPLSGGFAPPAAQANLRSVFHDFKACATLRILHFYLELRRTGFAKCKAFVHFLTVFALQSISISLCL